MKTLDDLIDKLQEMRDGIAKDAEQVSQKMALNFKALAVRRLQDQGIEGESYSDAGVPAYMYSNDKWSNSYARLNSGFDRMISDKKKKKELVSWKDVRSSQGLQTSKVDFTFTGRTLQNLSIVKTEVDDHKATSYLGGTNIETQDRLNYGHSMYGNFLKPNQEERKFLLEVATKEFKERIKKYKI